MRWASWLRGLVIATTSVHLVAPSLEAKSVDFSVDRGTAMSVDVAPDGRSVVFDLAGRIYELPIAGGVAQPLTHGSSIDRFPRFSPSGRHVAFVSDRSGAANLWVMDRDGSDARQISFNETDLNGTGVASPSWSPDGGKIVVSMAVGDAYASDYAPSALAVYDLVTGTHRLLHAPAGLYVNPSFMTDGQVLAARFSGRYGELSVVGVAGKSETPEGISLPDLPTSMDRPLLSHDRQWLAYFSAVGEKQQLRIRNLRTLEERWLPVESVAPDWRSTISVSPGYAFTPDDAALLLSHEGQLVKVALADGTVSHIPFTARVERDIAPSTLVQRRLKDRSNRRAQIQGASLSPDARQLVFTALDRVWLADLTGKRAATASHVRRLTALDEMEGHPAWSPDGRSIYYATWSSRGGAIRRARLPRHAADATQVIHEDEAMLSHIALSADGKRLAFIRVTRAVATAQGNALPALAASIRPEVWILTEGAASAVKVAELPWADAGWTSGYPLDPLSFTADARHLRAGLAAPIAIDTAFTADTQPVSKSATHEGWGGVSPDGRFSLEERAVDPFRLCMRSESATEVGAQGQCRYGFHQPWVTWTHDSRHAVLSQGSAVYRYDAASATLSRLNVALQIPSSPSAEHISILEHARVITMTSREPIEDGAVVIRGDRIHWVGEARDVPRLERARRYDLRGKTLIPGLIDLHDHLNLSGITLGFSDPDAWLLEARLRMGITSSRDAHTPTVLEMRARDLERAGQVLSPRLFSPGPALFDLPPRISSQEAAQIVGLYADDLDADFIKWFGGAISRKVRQSIVSELRHRGLNVTTHLSGDYSYSLGLILDGFGGLEHRNPNPLQADLARLQARSGIVQTFDFSHYLFSFQQFGSPQSKALWIDNGGLQHPDLCYPCRRGDPVLWRTPSRDVIAVRVADLIAVASQGGTVALSGHGDIPGLGTHYVARLAHAEGAPAIEVLRALTSSAAVGLGLAHDLGSIEVGKLADVVVLEGDPLQDMANLERVQRVFKGGDSVSIRE